MSTCSHALVISVFGVFTAPVGLDTPENFVKVA